MPILRPHWEALVAGEIQEWDMMPEMFAGAIDEAAEIGVHVYHVEKHEGVGGKGFTKWMLGEVEKELGSWVVKGWSALAVTEAGEGASIALGWKVVGGFVVREDGIVEKRVVKKDEVVRGWGKMLVGIGARFQS